MYLPVQQQLNSNSGRDHEKLKQIILLDGTFFSTASHNPKSDAEGSKLSVTEMDLDTKTAAPQEYNSFFIGIKKFSAECLFWILKLKAPHKSPDPPVIC